MEEKPNIDKKRNTEDGHDITPYTSGWWKTSVIATFVLALFTAAMAGFTGYSAYMTSRMADETAKTTSLVEKELQANLLYMRLQYLNQALAQERDIYYTEFYKQLTYYTRNTPGAAAIEELVANPDLCSTLGQYKNYCTQYHKYRRIYVKSWDTCNNAFKDLETKNFSALSEELDELQVDLNQLSLIYHETFFPATK